MEPRSARTNLIGAAIAGALVLLFSLILVWRDPLVFWNDDYQISILPVFADIARSWSEGHWPLLSPYSWVCGNLAGEFQYGTFSIFINAAVVTIWNIFDGFAHQAAALSIVHLVVLAGGGFVLAHSRGISIPLAIMVSLIAALNGWIVCWGASDWFGALGAFAWLPWAWWGLEKALRFSTLNAQRVSELRVGRLPVRLGPLDVGRLLPALWPAPFVYLVATGGFPYTIVMLGLLIAWLTIKSIVQNKSVWAPTQMLCGAALGFGIAAPAILALLAYVQGSARELQPASAHWQWIVPPAALPGLILPSWTAKWADFSTRYVPHTGIELAGGLVAPVALVCGLIFRGRLVFRRIGWDLVLLGVVLIAAMLPTAGVFRWSFRWLPFFHLILALAAAECLSLLGNRKNVAIGAFILALAIAIISKIVGAGGPYWLPLTWILIAIIVGWVVLEFMLNGRKEVSNWLPAAVTFGSLLATYLCISPNCGVPRYNFAESLTKPEPLDPARLYLSVYPQAEHAYRMEARPQPVGQIVRPGSTSMWARLHFVNGYSPIRPFGIARHWFFSIHGEIDLGTARWLLSHEAGPGRELAQLGIDGIIMANEMDFAPGPADEWELTFSNDEGRVFHRRGPPFERVRSVTTIASRPGMLFPRATVSDVRDFRNSVAADVEVPAGKQSALITFSRPYFDGYKATLGGYRLEVRSDRGLYPMVEVPAGSNGRLSLSYRPAWLVCGGAISLSSAALWLTALVFATNAAIRRRAR